MKLKFSKIKLLQIVLFFTMLLTAKLTVLSQTTSTDSLKCFTYSEARKIISDLNKIPNLNSIITRQDSIIKIDSVVIVKHEVKLETQRVELFDKTVKIQKMKKNRKLFFIFGGLLGLATQLLF